jgi:tetratricopeptide (TPR) repeat protein
MLYTKLRKFHLINCVSILVFLWLPVTNAYAEAHCVNVVGRFTSIEGEVKIRRESGGGWHSATMEQLLCEADSIKVGENSRAAIQLVNHVVLRLDQSTTLQLVDVSDNNEQWTWLDLSRGTIQSFSRAPSRVIIKARFLKGLIEGTEFYAQAGSNQSRLAVLEGHVKVENEQGSVTVDSGMEAISILGVAPQLQNVVRPRDAVQWALYYPPVLAVLDGRPTNLLVDASKNIQQALALVSKGQTAQALNILKQVPLAEHNASFFIYRASLLLSVGRINESRGDITQALRENPKAGIAYALLSIIEVVQNQREQALIDAEHAASLSTTSAVKIALSYAQQANFKLEAALETMLIATTEHADDSLAWARLGELQLMAGKRREALASAKQATKLSPGSSRAQIVLGFCALAEFRTKEAKSAFEQAIRLASADPMGRLGLGLAKIIDGDLVEGRREIEAAVALDSNSALLRGYLGKAYFTEKRSPLDAKQYGIAKSLDPLDPTVYLYDGIRKQSENRPVEALRDLQISKELNDNRSVYRSRLLLDQDRSTRGISVARIHKDLGFTLLGNREASLSLEDDPANASAHRFLSDTYQGTRRREIARVSELLQAQLLQDINLNPIQPSLAETNLNIITQGGPSSPGFNEFTPLFERNSAKFDVAGFGGSNYSFGGEGAVTALYDRFSFGAAGLHHQSDGWRDNNGLNQHIYDFFAQAAITPELNVQAEYRHRESKEGDLAFNFDPTAFIREKSVIREQDTTRLGFRFSPSIASNFVFSYIHADRKQQENIGSIQIDPTTKVSSDLKGHDEGDQFEGQYIYKHERVNLVAGFAHSQVDQRVNGKVIFNDSASPPPRVSTETTKDEIKSTRGYLYSRIKFPSPVTWTLGFSYDDYQEGLLSESSFNPKLGMQWDVTSKFRFRAAWMQTLKPALINNRTIEPTQIAGFNQLFDDINGTKSTRYGGGFDWHVTQDLFLGGEISWRHLDEPVTVSDRDQIHSVKLENRKEELHSLYLYWTPMDRLAIKTELVYDLYRSELGITTENGSVPEVVETFSAPISLGYFDPSGWFARLGGTFVHQKLGLEKTSIQDQGNDSFFLVDADLGYRFPKRWGLASIGVKNLFDKQFKYQDDSYREFRNEPSTGPYFPDRIIIGRIVLNF